VTAAPPRRPPAGVARLAGVTLLALVVAVLGGCQRDEDPRAELEAAIAATAADPFTYAITAQADRAALDELGGDAVAAAAFPEGAGLSGARDPDGRLEVALSLGGGVPLLEVVVEDGERLLLRTGLGEQLGLEGRDPSEALDPALRELGVGEAGRDALATSFAGGWVALTDVDDLGELLGGATDADPDADPGSVRSLLDEVAVTGARDAGEVRRLDVEVPAAALLGPLGLAGTDRVLPGTVDLRDGRLLEVRLELSGEDLAGVGGSGGADDPATSASAGVVELVLRIVTAEDAGALVPRPDPGASLTAAELFALVEVLQGGAGGSPAGSG
jgi:hypothetical protein